LDIRITDSARAHGPIGSRPLWGFQFGGGWRNWLRLNEPNAHHAKKTNGPQDYKYAERDGQKAVKYAPHAL